MSATDGVTRTAGAVFCTLLAPGYTTHTRSGTHYTANTSVASAGGSTGVTAGMTCIYRLRA